VEGMLLVARHRFDGEGQRKQRMVTYRSTGSDDAAAFDREGREVSSWRLAACKSMGSPMDLVEEGEEAIGSHRTEDHVVEKKGCYQFGARH
jgi:hypothetical protein